MLRPVFLLSLFLLTNCNAVEQLPYPKGDVRNCLPNPIGIAESPETTIVAASHLRMEVLPGTGFDNLRNKDMGQVADYSYSLCKTTNDGRYIIPDTVFVIPVQSSKFESFSEYFDHWDNYTSMTSFSINVDVSAFSLIHGKFSAEYQHVKNQQASNKAKTTRVQIRENLYTVKLQPDSRLNKNFENRLLDIASSLDSNDTDYAIYSAEMLVRDYGTHVTTSVEAGALIAQTDSVSSAYVATQDSESSSLTASASASFFNKLLSFDAGFGVKTSDSQTSAYNNHRHQSQVITIGGPPYKTNMTIREWEEGVPNSLVAIDRSGDPIYYFITPQTLPGLPEPIVYQIVELVYEAVHRYYRVNTHHGCTDPNSANFRYTANVDDGSCEAPHTSFQFGGVFQKCQVDPSHNYENLCTSYTQTNPLTGQLTCPIGYEEIELHSGRVSHMSKRKTCHDECNSYTTFIFFHHKSCKSVCSMVDVMSSATYQAFWCVDTGTLPPNSGYLFGGLYTTSSVNPVTNAKTCPKYFHSLHVGYEMEVCVSDSYDLASEYSYPFGGFFSCQATNPLTAGTKSCPAHYSSILASLDQGCEINYCTKLHEAYAISHPRLPPYSSKPSYPKNKTDTLVFMGANGELWLKNEDGDWVESNIYEDLDTGEELLALYTPANASASSSPSPTTTTNQTFSNGGLSSGQAVGITIAVMVVACTTVVFVVYVIHKLQQRKKKKKESKSMHATVTTSYMAINTNHEASPEEPAEA